MNTKNKSQTKIQKKNLFFKNSQILAFMNKSKYIAREIGNNNNNSNKRSRFVIFTAILF